MSPSKKIKLLINLPEHLLSDPNYQIVFKRFARNAVVRTRSWNTAEEISRELVWPDAIIMWAWPTLTDELLAKAERLRFIGHINDVRPMAEAELRRGLAISEARRGYSPAVAEMALTLMLAGLRQTSRYHMAMRQATELWPHYPNQRQLAGRHVGIVGFGGIGQGLATLLQPFRCTLRTFDPYIPSAIAKNLNTKRVPLNELIKKSEVVVLCAANTKEATHLMGAKQIAMLQKNAVLVNVGRSLLIDMKALAARLKKQDLIAMLDVFDKEPLERDSIFRGLPNTYLTPHRAGGIPESYIRILNMLADDFEAWMQGKKRQHVLTEKDLTSLAG